VVPAELEGTSEVFALGSWIGCLDISKITTTVLNTLQFVSELLTRRSILPNLSLNDLEAFEEVSAL
jgi:hypothetical protein